jgi:hypothetical protein
MQRISALAVLFGGLLSVTSTLAAEPGVPPVSDELSPWLASPSSEGGFPFDGPCSGKICRVHERVGCFNCYCGGSYKYPVPPRYTYFWPGIYSQQTMTAHVSPWRYPGLLSPDVVADARAPRNPPPLARSAQETSTTIKASYQAAPIPKATTALREPADQGSR